MVVEDAHVVRNESYLRGWVDRSLLDNYEDHVARQLWKGVVSNNVDIHALKWMFYVLEMLKWYSLT